MARPDRKNIRAERRDERAAKKDVKKNVKSERKGPKAVGAPAGAGTGLETLGRTTNTSAAATNRERAAARAMLPRGEQGGFTEFQGEGGWAYRKYADGEIRITDAPASNVKAIGMTLRPGDRFYDAIDAEMAGRPLPPAPPSTPASPPSPTAAWRRTYDLGETPVERVQDPFDLGETPVELPDTDRLRRAVSRRASRTRAEPDPKY